MEVINYDALCVGFSFIIAFIFFLAWVGMSSPKRYTAGRPPDHPPGWKNRKKHL